MKHLIVGSLILAIMLSVGLARAFDGPEGFKGVRFGDSEQMVRSWLNPFRATDVLCGGHDHARVFGDRVCSGRSTIGDIPVGVNYVFRADKLVQIHLSFSAEAFPELKAACGTRFGALSDSKESIVKTGGIEGLNEMLFWQGTTVQISLFKYAGVTESTGSYHLLTDVAAIAALLRQQGSKAAESLK